MKRGIYFLANDSVYEQVAAFLASLRHFNPDIALQFVPFDDDCRRVAALAADYGFTRWGSDAELERCDRISRRFHDEVRGHYRKLALWSGEFDEFVYIDCDTVVMHPLDFAFEYLDWHGFVTSHSNIPPLRRFVWKESVRETGALTAKQANFSANTGFIASRRGALDLDQIERDLERPLAIADHMALECVEQPLLNYLMVTSGQSYSSLMVIKHWTRSSTIPLERWGGADLGEVDEGRLVADPTPTLLVHWAGEWQKARIEQRQIRNLELWLHYRSLHPEPYRDDRVLIGGRPEPLAGKALGDTVHAGGSGRP